MSRTRVILMSAFLLVMCAGVVVGRLWNELPIQAKTAGGSPSWLADQLNLRPDQRQQMDAIWAETGPRIQKSFDDRQSLDREREQKIQELLTPAEWTAYDKIVEDFRAKRAVLDKGRHQLVMDANAKSVALLDDAQKQKWEELRELHEHDWHGPHGHTTSAGPATQPSPPTP
jgi:Spy/CpxP family protein refolding chaperone